MKSVSAGEVVHRRQPVSKSRHIRIGGPGDDISCVQVGASRQKRLEAGADNAGGNARKLDVEHVDTRLRQRGFSRAHHLGGARERAARTHFRDSDQAKPNGPVSGARRELARPPAEKERLSQSGRERERNCRRKFQPERERLLASYGAAGDSVVPGTHARHNGLKLTRSALHRS